MNGKKNLLKLTLLIGACVNLAWPALAQEKHNQYVLFGFGSGTIQYGFDNEIDLTIGKSTAFPEKTDHINIAYERYLRPNLIVELRSSQGAGKENTIMYGNDAGNIHYIDQYTAEYSMLSANLLHEFSSSAIKPYLSVGYGKLSTKSENDYASVEILPPTVMNTSKIMNTREIINAKASSLTYTYGAGVNFNLGNRNAFRLSYDFIKGHDLGEKTSPQEGLVAAAANVKAISSISINYLFRFGKKE